MRLQPTLAFLAAIGLGLTVTYWPSASAQQALNPPTQQGCSRETLTCTSGSCTRAVPDAGNPVGLNMQDVRGYTVNVCANNGRLLAGSGTLRDYHCQPTYATCPEVTGKAQSVTATAACQEFPPFVVPALLPATDFMVWAASAVTISNWDAGTADTITVSICPAK